MVKETVILYKKEIRKMKKSRVSLLDVKEMKTRNDCEIACDCVKRANVVLHVGLCEEIFARKYTATHKPTSAQPLSAPHSDQRDTHKIAGRLEPRRPPMTDEGTETAFRLDQRKYFWKSNISWGQRSIDAIKPELHLRRSTSTGE